MRDRGLLPTEAQLHDAVADFLRKAMPAEIPWTTFPLGGGGALRGAFLRRKGTRKGWPDLQFVVPPRGRLIAIELKTKSSVSEEQAETIGDLRRVGALAAVARSVEDVEFILRQAGVRLNATTGGMPAWLMERGR